MKKTALLFAWILIILNHFQLLSTIFFSCLGYSFEFKLTSLLAIIIGLLTAIFMVLLLTHNNLKEIKALHILIFILAPLSIINMAVHIIVLKQFTLPIAISLFASTVFLCVLSIVCVKPLGLKIATLVLSVIMLQPVGLMGLFTVADFDFGETSVIKSIDSPNGTYYAEVIRSDQGALGGDTSVIVHCYEEINNDFFRISKKTQTVYFGEWYEYENINVYWKDDESLIINSKEYKIE